jgi:hypothetical protein
MSDSFIVSTATTALTANASAASSTGLQVSGGGEFVAGHTFTLAIPALTTGMLPHNETMTYSVETSTAASGGTWTTLIPVIAQQVGSASAGAAGSTMKFRTPDSTLPFVRVTATPSAGAGDAHTVSFVLNFSM